MAGRAVKAGVLALLLIPAAQALRAADGDLDPSFSGDGKVVVDWGSSAWGEAMAAAPDGRLVVAGKMVDEWAVTRLTAGGALDAGWALAFEPFDFTATGAIDTNSVLAARVDAAGRVVLAGDIQDASSNYRLGLARLTSTGALDGTFSGDGLEMVTAVPAGWDLDPVEAAHIASDGVVVVVGACGDCPAAGQDGFFVLRTLPSGLPDPAFSGDGWQAFALAGFTSLVPTAVAVSDSGAVTIAGWGDSDLPGEQIWVARLTAAGALDSTFGGGDGVMYPPNYAPRVPTDLAVDPDTGAIVLAVSNRVFPAGGGGLVGVTGAGALDTDFGTNGLLDLDLEEGAWIEAVRFQSDGRVVAAGEIDANGTQAGGFFLARALADGTLDPSFDGNGVKRVEFDRTPNAVDGALALALSGGRLVAAGYAEGESLPRAFAVVRTASALVFTDGFERGSTSAWGGD